MSKNLTMNRSDEFWMYRCLQLAKKGAGFVSPNPLVGAVIVRNGIKISEGYHKQFGGPHAEINAINNALAKKINLIGSTLYVNLEPCFHFGKTPPCVNAILEHGISRVVIATKDPNPLVSEKSIKKLKKGGVTCSIGILKQDAELLNEKFFTFITTGRPFIAIKAAQTFDGFIAKNDGSSKWITNERSRKFSHQLRSAYDAIIVGAGTVKSDNPELTVRNVRGRNPIRIVVDGKLSTNPTNKIFNTKSPTIIYTASNHSKIIQNKIFALEKKGVIVVKLESSRGILKIGDIIKDLADHQISSILIEGGQKIYAEFINAGVIDKVYLFTAKKKFKSGLRTFTDNIKPIIFFQKSHQIFGSDILEEFYVKN